MATALRMRGICKSYPGVQALKDVDFDCEPGEIHAVVGENGSGKSTLLGVASGAVVADAGTVEVLGEPLKRAHPAESRRMGLAAVYQDNSLVLELSVAENLYLGAPEGERPKYSDMTQWARQKIKEYDLGMIEPEALVGNLSPAQRQFVEIIKALLCRPKVLLLDEPTTALDVDEIKRLQKVILEVAAAGTAIVYVSHRLREVLRLARRVTVLRDGEHQGTYMAADLSEGAIVALMIGNPVDVEFPPKGAQNGDGCEVVLSAERWQGSCFGPIDLRLHKGEILGLAGAEGNGQRELLRALAGLEPANGTVTLAGRRIHYDSPRGALRAGITMLSGDRFREAIFPELGVRHNMTIQVIDNFSRMTLIAGNRERQAVFGMIKSLKIATPSLDKQTKQLSGGNQQKTALARAFLYPAKVLAVEEPTQGVDAKARLDIYRALRAKAAEGLSIIVKSADALELAGLCDRVLVLSRGQVTRELQGEDLSEESIVGSFTTSDAQRSSDWSVSNAAKRGSKSAALLPTLFGSNWLPLWVLVLLMLIVGAYVGGQSPVFLTSINFHYWMVAVLPLALVSIGQLNVLLVRGFDVSVGATASLTVVLLSVLIPAGSSATATVIGITSCLAAGVVVGGANAVFIRAVGMNPFVATIATMSVVQGIALVLRPQLAGPIDSGFLDVLRFSIGIVPWALIVLVLAVIAGDFWLHRTGGGLSARSIGFREEAARRNGVATGAVQIRAYVLSGLLASVAGLLLATDVAIGHPTIGSGLTLVSFTAPVLGGASLFGGRGTFVGALFGAVFLTLVMNVIPLLHLMEAYGLIATGLLTLVAILLYSSGGSWRRVWALVGGRS